MLIPDTFICLDSTLLIRVEPPGVFSHWKWNTGRSQPEIVVWESGTYAVTVTSAEGGCVYEDSVAVTVVSCSECPVYVPNVFSPNDDGWNDVFGPQSNCSYLDFHLQVFDRWGNLLFSTHDPATTWDGRFRGKDLTPGVFIWVLETDTELFGKAERRQFSGSVTLVR